MTTTPTPKKPLSALQREDVPYTSHYCEENTYKLIEKLYAEYDIDEGEEEKTNVYAVFVSNPLKRTLVWMQRLSADDLERPVVWDYHVFAMTTSSHPEKKLIIDYDSVLPYPCSSTEYILKAFRPQLALRPEFIQLFRVIPGREYLSRFSSDRSHMATSGLPEPSWPHICGSEAKSAMELPSLWTMSTDEIGVSSDHTHAVGTIFDVRSLLQFAREHSNA
jgi:hypothetical protein